MGRVRLARMLLGASLGVESSAQAAESGELTELLQHKLWPLMGISERTHACLLAWSFFMHFMRHPGAVTQLR